MNRIPLKHHRFISMDANAGTGVKTGEEERKMMGAYGRDSRFNDSNGIPLMQFADEMRLALIKTFFSTPKGYTSRTFNVDANRPADKKYIDDVLTQDPRSPVRKKSSSTFNPQLAGLRPRDRVRLSAAPWLFRT